MGRYFLLHQVWLRASGVLGNRKPAESHEARGSRFGPSWSCSDARRRPVSKGWNSDAHGTCKSGSARSYQLRMDAIRAEAATMLGARIPRPPCRRGRQDCSHWFWSSGLPMMRDNDPRMALSPWRRRSGCSRHGAVRRSHWSLHAYKQYRRTAC